MKPIFIVTLLIALFSQNLFGTNKNTDANIVGHVICNNAHVPFVNVTIDGTTIGTTTDETGHFQLINLPEGKFTVRVSGIGYKSKIQMINTVSKATHEMKFQIEEDILHVEEFVVSADRNKTNRSEAPLIITSISPKVFEATQSRNIAEGLNFTPGLRTEDNCQNCGFTQLRINGMEGPYSQILMNSRPVFSGLVGVYGLELIPANMVERLEVIRGGGSALFGGNAIAGTVNIITKEPSRNSFSVDARMGKIGVGNHGGAKPSDDSQVSFNASVISDDRKAGGYMYGLLRNKAPYDENGDGFSESLLIENSTFGFSNFYKTGIRSKITLDGYRVSEFRRGGDMFDYLPQSTNITEQINHLITGGNLAFDLFFENSNKLMLFAAGQTVDRDTYYGTGQDPDAFGHTDDLTTSVGAQFVMHSDELFSGSATSVFGLDNNNNSINDVKQGTKDGYQRTPVTHQMVNTIGSFVQHDWKSKKVNVSVGLRYDYNLIRDLDATDFENSDYKSGVFAPRIGAMYKVTSNTKFRLGYAKGYRTPQVYNEDLHVELVNARRVEHINDENLVEETSHSLTASLNKNFVLGASMHEILVEGFYTRLLNPFSDEYFPLSNNETWVYKRINADGYALVNGVNIEFNSVYSNKLEMQMGFTIQKSMFEKAQPWGDISQYAEHVSKDFLRSPNTYGYATFSWHPLMRLQISPSINYTGSMYVPHFGLSQNDYDEALVVGTIKKGDVIVGERLEKTEQFLIVDLLFSYDFILSNSTKIQIYGGIKNMFNQTQKTYDKGIFRDSGYMYGPSQPRTLNVGVKFGNLF